MLRGRERARAHHAEIGLVLKAVPPELLEAEVEGRADRLALMGAQVLQRLAAENDARGHLAPATKEYFRAVEEKGLASAFNGRDAKFGDGRARVDGPELRDERGFLLPPERER